MNVLIVEDEAPAARRLARITSELLGEEAGSLAIKASVEEAEQHLASCGVDVVLLDLNLNGSSGFDLLSRMTAGSFHTIVVSASLDKALAAFEYGVLDFVPKPVERERLARAFSRPGADARKSSRHKDPFRKEFRRGEARAHRNGTLLQSRRRLRGAPFERRPHGAVR